MSSETGVERRGFVLGLTTQAALGSGARAEARSAREFRFSFQADAASLDPLFIDEAFTIGFLANVYEGLTRWSETGDVVPALATGWEAPSPTEWVFKLRPGVVFHDGATFAADDVLFSFERFRHPDSIFRRRLSMVTEVVAVDPMTVRVVTSQPTPILPRLLVPMPIMNRAWAVKNGAERPANNTKGIQSYASDNSNGTGPFKIVERKPDVMTRFEVHRSWWDKLEHNITSAVFQPIKSAGTRQAALISGQIDMMWPVPLSDIDRLKAAPEVEVDAIASEWDIMLRFNFGAAELRSSAVTGKNPFHDVRVREAVYRAIDIDAINRAVMRGLARPAALPIAPTINGYDAKIDVRPKADPARARQLLAEAGYPNGFSFAIHVPNDRYLNDEAIGAAVAPMLARAGLKVTVVSQARARHFAMAAKGETDFYMQGTATATLKDGFEALSLLFYTPGPTAGSSNYGKYSNPKVDALIDKLTVEGDAEQRRRLMSETFAVLQQEWAFVPLHIQPSVWAMRKGFRPLHLPDDAVRLWRVQVD